MVILAASREDEVQPNGPRLQVPQELEIVDRFGGLLHDEVGKLEEGREVGRFSLLEYRHDLLHAVSVQLVVNSRKVDSSTRPELDLSERTGVLGVLSVVLPVDQVKVRVRVKVTVQERERVEDEDDGEDDGESEGEGGGWD